MDNIRRAYILKTRELQKRNESDQKKKFHQNFKKAKLEKVSKKIEAYMAQNSQRKTNVLDDGAFFISQDEVLCDAHRGANNMHLGYPCGGGRA